MPTARKIKWDDPANLTIPEGPASKPLWEYCHSLGSVKAAKRLGIAPSSVYYAVNKRAQATEAVIDDLVDDGVPAPAPDSAPEPDMIEELVDDKVPAPAPCGIMVDVRISDPDELAAAVKQAMADTDQARHVPQPGRVSSPIVETDDEPETMTLGGVVNLHLKMLRAQYGPFTLVDLATFLEHAEDDNDDIIHTLLEIVRDENYGAHLEAYLAGLSRGRQVQRHA